MDAAIKAKAIKSARGARTKQIRHRLNTKIPSRTKLGITTVKQQIRKDRMHMATSQSESLQLADIHQLSLDHFIRKQPHPSSTMGNLKSNKRLRKPD